MKTKIEQPNQKRWKIGNTPHIKYIKLCILHDLININLHIIINKLNRSDKIAFIIIRNYILRVVARPLKFIRTNQHNKTLI